jgi:hypothetical protein
MFSSAVTSRLNVVLPKVIESDKLVLNREATLDFVLNPKINAEYRVPVLSAFLKRSNNIADDIPYLVKTGLDRKSNQALFVLYSASKANEGLFEKMSPFYQNALKDELLNRNGNRELANLSYVAFSYGNSAPSRDNAVLKVIEDSYQNEKQFRNPNLSPDKQSNLLQNQVYFALAISKLDPDYLINFVRDNSQSMSLDYKRETTTNYAIYALSTDNSSEKISTLMRDLVVNPETNPHVVQFAIKYTRTNLNRDPELTEAYRRISSMHYYDKEAQEEAEAALKALEKN